MLVVVRCILGVLGADRRMGPMAVLNEMVHVLEQESRNAYDTAVKKTNEILTPEQRTKYEEILKRNQWDRGGPRQGS